MTPVTVHGPKNRYTGLMTKGLKRYQQSGSFHDEERDRGVIVLQRAIPVLPSDDAHTLAARILDEEHQAYPEAIARVLSGRFQVAGRRYVEFVRS